MKTSEIVRQNKGRIMQRWLEQVKVEMPEADEHGHVALRNDLPDLLNDIVANTDQQAGDQDAHNSFEHGYLRATFKNYSMAHVVREYRILMDVLLKTIDEQGTVSVSDRDKIIFAVTMAIEEASQIFFRERQQQSEDAQQVAEELSDKLQHEGQLRDDFISTVTHDIRNPLASIRSLVSLLQTSSDESNSSKTEKLLEAIDTSATRADELIQNLLDVNLIRIGEKLPISPQSCDLSDTIRAAVTAFKTDELVDIRLQIEEPLTVFCDAEALRRALDNLLSNAIKYGDGLITVRAHATDDGGAQLSVHNEGNAIPADQQQKIFSRYYRRQGQHQIGWGIGLSLVQGIIEAHDGTVSLSSTAEEGTEFTLHLPPQEK